jgi:hypothetical protein
VPAEGFVCDVECTTSCATRVDVGVKGAGDNNSGESGGSAVVYELELGVLDEVLLLELSNTDELCFRNDLSPKTPSRNELVPGRLRVGATEVVFDTVEIAVCGR